MMTTKKINKVIVYYDDGTYEEIKTSPANIPNQAVKDFTSPSFVDLRPDYYKIRDWAPSPPYQPTYVVPNVDPSLPPWTVTCGTGSVPLNYTVTTEEPRNWKFTSTGNFAPDDKYSITSTGNGNVDLSK